MAQLRPAQAAVLECHLDVWECLSAARRLDLDPRIMAAGKERMLAALSSASRGGRGVFSRLFLIPLLRSAAIVLGLLVLTGAAAGASAALGGPHLWRSVGVNRNIENVIERPETGEVNPAGEGIGSDAGGGDEDTGNAGSPGSSEGPSSSDGSDADEEYLRDKGTEEYKDSIAADAAPEGGAEGSGPGAASSSPDDDLDEDEARDDEDEERWATPKLDLTPTPILQQRANMAYDGDAGDDTSGLDSDPDDEDSSSEGDGEDIRSNSGSSAAAQPHQGPANARADREKPIGQGQSSQQPSRR